jgi:peptidoglycan/xylan/chitin deacetylase (PgdA/CDA1 family)
MPSAIGSLKTAVKAVIATRPGFALSRRRRKPGCIVLLYHRVGTPSDPFPNLDADSFRAQMEWLARNCNVIAPEELRDRVSTEHASSSRPDVLVTFDDGYRGHYEHAAPALRRLGMRAMNFLCTRFVDEPTLVAWWDRLYLAVRRADRSQAALPWAPARTYTLDDDGRSALLRTAKDHIKRLPEAEKAAAAQAVLDALGVDPDVLRPARQTMTWNEVRAAADVTSYGGHTHNHMIVSRLEAAQLDSEVRTCRDRIAAELGAAPDTFAYPNGRAIDFTEQAKETLRRYGFRTAFSAIDGINGTDTDWMEVRRIAGGASVRDLAWRISRLGS